MQSPAYESRSSSILQSQAIFWGINLELTLLKHQTKWDDNIWN